MFPSPVLCSYQHSQTSSSLSCGWQERSLTHKTNSQSVTVTHRYLSGFWSHCLHDRLSRVFLYFVFLPPSSVSRLLPLNCSVNFQKSVTPPSSDHTGSKVRGLSKLHQALNPPVHSPKQTQQPKLNSSLCSQASIWLYYFSLSVETLPRPSRVGTARVCFQSH